MQFRKTAVAVAIAGIAASAPQIASADTVLSGAVTIGLFGNDVDTPLLDEDGAPVGEVNTGDVRLGVDQAVLSLVATQELDSGFEAFGSIRVDADDFSGSNVTGDNIFIGVRSGTFGELRVGEVPIAAEYGQLAGDIFDQTGDVNDGVAYTGSFGPATIGVTWSPQPNTDVIGVGAVANFGSFTVGAGAEQRGQGGTNEVVNYSVGASFAFAGASFAAHFVSTEPTEAAAGFADPDDSTILGFNAGYGIFGASIGLSYFIRDTDRAPGQGEDLQEQVFRVDVGYGLGGGLSVSGRVNFLSGDVIDAQPENEREETNYRILLTKSF